jgi:hypothetical protein
VRPTPAAFGRDVGAALEAVLVKALALSPGDRYPDARAFRDALDAALAHPSVVEAAAEPREVSAADGASRASVTATPAPEDPARSSGGAPSTGRVLIAQVALVVVLVAALVGLLRGRPSEPPRVEARARADGTFNDAAHPDVIREAATTRRLARPGRIVRRDASPEPADGERATTPVTPTTPDAGAGETRPDVTAEPVREPIADAGRASVAPTSGRARVTWALRWPRARRATGTTGSFSGSRSPEPSRSPAGSPGS